MRVPAARSLSTPALVVAIAGSLLLGACSRSEPDFSDKIAMATAAADRAEQAASRAEAAAARVATRSPVPVIIEEPDFEIDNTAEQAASLEPEPAN